MNFVLTFFCKTLLNCIPLFLPAIFMVRGAKESRDTNQFLQLLPCCRAKISAEISFFFFWSACLQNGFMHANALGSCQSAGMKWELLQRHCSCNCHVWQVGKVGHIRSPIMCDSKVSCHCLLLSLLHKFWNLIHAQEKHWALMLRLNNQILPIDVPIF